MITHALAQGSLAGAPAEAAYFLTSKPVRFTFGAIVVCHKSAYGPFTLATEPTIRSSINSVTAESVEGSIGSWQSGLRVSLIVGAA